MNIEKIMPLLRHVEDTVSQMRDLLFCPDGIRITVVWRDDLSYVEYWDGDMPPRIFGLTEEKVEESIIQQWVFEVIGMLPPSACGQKEIELHTDIVEDSYIEGIRMGINIFEIKIKPVSINLLTSIRGRHDFNNYLSRVKEAQDRFNKSDESCGNN